MPQHALSDAEGPQALAAYWARIEHQRDITLGYQVLAETPGGGIAQWHVTYQVASEELFAIRAASTGTGLPDRKQGAHCLSWQWTGCWLQNSQPNPIGADSAAVPESGGIRPSCPIPPDSRLSPFLAALRHGLVLRGRAKR